MSFRIPSFSGIYSRPSWEKKHSSSGYDGIDICAREGHPIHLGNVATALPEAMGIWRD